MLSFENNNELLKRIENHMPADMIAIILYTMRRISPGPKASSGCQKVSLFYSTHMSTSTLILRICSSITSWCLLLIVLPVLDVFYALSHG